MEKILLTGGAGYLGSVLVGHLLRRGYRVTVIDSLIYGGSSLLQYCTDPNFDFVTGGDVRDEELMRRLIQRHDGIIPLAAVVGASACDRNPEAARSINFDSIVLLNRLRRPDQKVIWPCTNSGYGTRSSEAVYTEDSSLEPNSLYGETKVDAECELLASPNTISLRLASVFGPSPRMRFDLLVHDFVWRAVSDGYLVLYEKGSRRNFVHIEDVAECFCFCLEHFDEVKGQAYNVGLNNANLTKLELALKIKGYVPKLYIHEAEVGSDPDKRDYLVSNEKINRKGFAAKRTLDQGVQELLKTFRLIGKKEVF